jgi:hypothetical protein
VILLFIAVNIRSRVLTLVELRGHDATSTESVHMFLLRNGLCIIPFLTPVIKLSPFVNWYYLVLG